MPFPPLTWLFVLIPVKGFVRDSEVNGLHVNCLNCVNLLDVWLKLIILVAWLSTQSV